MPSPIDALERNVLQAFERPDGTLHPALLEAIAQGRIRGEIELHIDEAPPRCPRVVAPPAQTPYIVLHVAYLELLWAFVYGWAVLFEEGVQRPMCEKRWDGRILLDTRTKERAARLLNWASSLKTAYSPWPENLPIPDPADNEPDRIYALRANGIFQTAVSFALYHEFAHVQQGHIAVHVEEDSDGDIARAIEMETEADDFAFGVFVSATDNENHRMLRGWALLAPALSSLYLVDSLIGVFQRRHPHLHHRVAHMLTRLNFQEAGNRFYFTTLCAFVLAVLSNAHRVTGDADVIEPQSIETAEEALQAELDYLDKLAL